jgi:hypothetical protein
MENIVPFPTPKTPYTKVLDWETLKVVTRRFRDLHPDLLPIVVYRCLDSIWVGDLTADQVKQALRDCFDMTERAKDSPVGLYSPLGFLQKRLLLCLENQALGLDDASCPDSPTVPAPESKTIHSAPVSLLGALPDSRT